MGTDFYGYPSYITTTGYTAASTSITIDGSMLYGGNTISYAGPAPEEDDDRSENERWLDGRIEEISVEL